MWLWIRACASIFGVARGCVAMSWFQRRRSLRAVTHAGEIRCRRRSRRIFGWATALLLASSAPALAGDPEPERAPSVAQLESGCLSRCASEGRDEAICGRYCDCNLETLGRDLSEAEFDRMIQLAASDARGAQQIRAWMRDTAIACRGKIFGAD